MTTLTVTVLDVADPEAAVAAIDAAAPGLRRRLSASLRDALRGRPAAARRYVAAHRELIERLLAAMHEARPDLVVRDDAGEHCVAHPGGRSSRAGIELLRTFAADAPFSPWVQLKGPGTGVALDLLARARALLPGVEPLALPAGASFPRLDDPDALLRFTRLVAVAQQAEQSDLERLRAVFGLSVTELGGLFGVTRQAAGLWLADGPPAARRAKAATVAAIADVLARRLKPTRIPGIARRPVPEYGDKSMLELIAADRYDWLLDSVRRSFDYAATA
ncbi:MAG: hypothetical protein WCP98_00920 [Actinomycetes bacterium]